MAWIERRVTRTSQPQELVGVDWSNPLAAGLVFSTPQSGAEVDLAGGKKKTTTGLVGRGVNHLGEFSSYGSGRDAYPSFGEELSASTPATIFWIQEPRSAAAHSTVAQFRPSGSANPFLVYQSSSFSQYHFVIGPHGGAAPSFSSSIGEPSNGVVDNFAVVCTTNLASRLPGDYILFKNGGVNTTGATAPFGGSSVTQTTIGANATGGDPFEGLIGNFCIWNRALSDAEIKSLSDNPWQIFEPIVEYVWVDDFIDAAPTGPTVYYRVSSSTLDITGNPRRKTSPSKKVGSITASSTTAEKIVLTRIMRSTLTMSGSIARKIRKKFLGSTTATAAVTKKVLRKLSSSLSFIGTTRKRITKSLLGSLPISGFQQRAFRIISILAGSITSSGVSTNREPPVSTPSDDAPVALSFLRRYLGRR